MSRAPGRRPALRPVLALLLAAVAWWTVGTGTAGADPARPTNYESRVLRVAPPVDGVRVEVVGGDAFLRVTARPGVTVTVPGYDGEPYLRIRSDGVVERNDRSPAAALNRSLTGGGPLPAGADSAATPRWVPTGEVGSAAWHDHRIHWMLSQAPVPGPHGFVQRWTVPLEVDGREVTAVGVLRYHDDAWAAAALAALFGAVAAAATLLVTRGDDGSRRAAAALAAAAGVALVLAWSTFRSNPPDVGASLLPVVVCGAALVLALLAPVVRRPWAPSGAVALLAGWALLRLPTLWKPVIPSTLPGWVERGGTAAVLGVAVAAAVVVVRRPVPAPEGAAG